MFNIIVVELSDITPRRCEDKPNLYVGLTSDDIHRRFENIRTRPRPAWISGHVRKLRTDLCVSTRTSDAATARRRRSEVSQALSEQGYTVNRNTRLWSVYVVELDPSGIKDVGDGYVYVGQTSLTPEARFAQHLNQTPNKKGTFSLSVKVVRERGIKLRPDISPMEKFFSLEQSKTAERELAAFLRNQGYKVEGGH